MSLAEFMKTYDSVRGLPLELKKIEALGTKGKIGESLIAALKALRIAEELIFVQSDTITRTNNELLEQCKRARSDQAQNSGQTQINSFSAAIKTAPKIVMKKAPGTESLSIDQIDSKMKSALKNVQVNKTHVKNADTLFIEVSDEQNLSAAIGQLQSEFSDFNVEESKKVAPKLTVMNVPLDISETDFIAEIRAKDSFLTRCLDEGEDEFQVIKSWNMKNRAGNPSSRKMAVKCSPRVRNHIVERSGGYVYLNLLRCKVYDRFYVPQCYHCQKYNHFSRACPDKEKAPTCAKCAGTHDTKGCNNNNVRKCVNCIRAKESKKDHFSFALECPSLEKAQRLLKSNTNYNESKN